MSDIIHTLLMGVGTVRDTKPEMRILAGPQSLVCLYSWKIRWLFLGPQTVGWTARIRTVMGVATLVVT